MKAKPGRRVCATGARFFAGPGGRPYDAAVVALPSIWIRRVPLAALIALALGWLPYQLYGQSGLSRLVRLRAELAALSADNRVLREHNRRLRAELSLSDDDDLGAVERIARDELGLVKPGERVWKVEVAR